MEVWLAQRFKWAAAQQCIIIGLVLLGILQTIESSALETSFNNEHYSIVEEHQICDQIIPKFIEQIMSHQTSKCEESGVFPKPGNCSAFFKCVKSGTTIQPLIEYCESGYNFVQGACVPHGNSSECPQFTCRIPDGTHAIGNEVEVNDESKSNGNDFQSLPLVDPPSISPVSVEVEGSTSTTEVTIHESQVKNSSITVTHTNPNDSNHPPEQFMQMTQTKEKSSVSSNKPTITLMFAIMFFQFIYTK